MGQSAIKHPLVQSELNKIINNPTKSLRYLDDQFIEIKNNIDGSTQTFSLQINELDSGSVDQVIDLTNIDTSLYSGMYRIVHQIPVSNAFGNRVIVSDINTNGLIELTGIFQRQFSGVVFQTALYEQTVSGDFVRQILLADSLRTTIGPRAIDFDQDGLNEIVLSNSDSRPENLEIEWQDSLVFRKNFVANSILLNGSLYEFTDFDKDSYPDLVSVGSDSGGSTNPTYFAEYDPVSNNFEIRDTFDPVPHPRIYSYSVGDSDNDGWPDAVGSSVLGRVFVAENDGDNSFRLVWENTLENQNAALMISSNDIDQNGKAEFLICTTGLYQGQGGMMLYWFEAFADNQYAIQKRIFFQNAPFFGFKAIYAYDMDFDGVQEIVIIFEELFLFLKGLPNQQLELYFAALPPQSGQEITGLTLIEGFSDKEEDFLVSVYDLARIPFRKAFYYKRAPQTSLANHPTDALFPQSAKLGWGYPNPFNSNIQIPYSVYSSTTISLAIYDIHGRLIQRLINNDQHMPGDYEVTWDGYNKERKEVSSGIYFLVLRYGGFQTSQKIFLIR